MTGSGSNGAGRLAGAAIRCQSDSRLVGLVREGHDLAFEEIVRRYRRQLVGFAGAIVPRDHAEDVVQEALTKAHGALERGDSEINLRPWLYAIVRNRALNALRDEPVHDDLDENFDGVSQPPEIAARREELALLIAGLRGLPVAQQQAIVGRELEGRSHEEIAGSLGTTPGAVRGLIYRARTALRDGLGLLIPLPLLRALLGSGTAGSEAAGAGGAAAAGLVAGGGGVAMKAGATLGVAVIAVGSGIAIQHRGSKSDDTRVPSAHATEGAKAHSARSASARLVADTHGGRRGPGSDDSGDRGEDRGPSSSGGTGESSGEGSSGSGDGGHSGPGGGGDDGGSGSGDDGGSVSGSSGSGSSGSGDSGTSGSGGDDGGGSGTSGSGGDDGGGSGTSGSGTSGSGSGETSTSDGDVGDSSGPGGGGGETTTTTTTDGESGGSG